MAKKTIEVKLRIDEKAIASKLEGAIDDDVRQFAHERLADYAEPYVPAQTTMLAKSTIATPDHLRYHSVYAAVQYEGMTKGSEANPPRPFNYRTDVHPKATSEWDKAAMADHKDDLIAEIEAFIRRKQRRAK